MSAMTTRANRLTKPAKDSDRGVLSGMSDPAWMVRVFMEAMARLGYDVDPLFAQAGLRRRDFERDPDARILCATYIPTFLRALQQRPMKNPGVKLAAATPIGSFPLFDYLMVTSDSVGAAIGQLPRYLGLIDNPHVVHVEND